MSNEERGEDPKPKSLREVSLDHIDQMDEEAVVFFHPREQSIDQFLKEWRPSKDQGPVREIM